MIFIPVLHVHSHKSSCYMYMYNVRVQYIMVEGKGLSRILSREIVAWVGTRADVCALIGTPVRIQPVYVYTTIHT